MTRFRRESAAVVVVDIQERLVTAMKPAAYERMLNRSIAAVVGARALGMPIVATQQYSKGLGPLVPPLLAQLGDVKPFEKSDFSAASDEVLAALTGRSQVLIVGMETHICVFQTARGLAERGLTAFVATDAVLSRTEVDHSVGLSLCSRAGASLVTVESALFDALGSAKDAAFKAISAAVK